MVRLIKNIIIALLIIGATSCSKKHKIPEELHGFWQFHVDRKGKWNGMHIGENYVEIDYNLASLKEFETTNKGYVIKVNDGKKTTDIQVELLSGDSAIFRLGKDDIFRCKKYNADPDIEILQPEKYVKLFEGKWFEKYKEVKTPFKIFNNTIEIDNEKWNIIWFGEYLKKEYRALLERNGKYQLAYITFYNGKKRFKLVNHQGEKEFTTKLTDDRSVYLAYNRAYFPNSKTKDLESISVDFEVQTKIPSNIKVCVSPIFSLFNKRSVQAAISSQTEQIVKEIVGKDTICDTGGLLSTFWTQNLKLGKTAKNGIKFSGVHDGTKYITMRNKIKWGKGKYRVKLFKSGYSKGKALSFKSIKYDQEYSLNEYEHSWLTMIFENLENGKKWTIGSVAVPGRNIRMDDNYLVFFVEIYGTPINFIGENSNQGLFYKNIPTVKVVYKNLKINNEKVYFDKLMPFFRNKVYKNLGIPTLNKEKDAIECEIGYKE